MYTDLFPFFFWAVWASGNDALGAVITAQFPIRLLTDFLCSQKHSKVSFELPEGFSVTAEKWQQQGMFRVTRNLSGYSESLAAGLPLRSRATCSNLVVFLVYSLYFMPYNLILLYSVVRPMPSNAAANLRLPFACSSARIICFFSISSISSEASDVSGISSNSNVSAVDRIALGMQHRQMHDPFQLSHVAAPRIGKQPFSCLRVKAFYLLFKFLVGKV